MTIPDLLWQILMWIGGVVIASILIFTLARIGGYAAHRGWSRYKPNQKEEADSNGDKNTT